MRLNVSRLKAFLECPQRYNWRYERNLVPFTERRGALDFGTAIHEALRVWYCGGEGLDPWDATEALRTFNLSLPDDHEQRSYGALMLAAYFDRYESDHGEWVVRGAEIPLQTECEGGVTLIGRVDLLIECPKWGPGLWMVQHKTVGNTVALDSYVRQYDLDPHERAYRFMLESNGWGKVNGTILNMLRKTKAPSFDRQFIPVSDEAVEDFHNTLTGVKEWLASPFRPKNTGSCMKYNSLCPYHTLCCGQEVWEDQWKEREPDYVDDPELLTLASDERRG